MAESFIWNIIKIKFFYNSNFIERLLHKIVENEKHLNVNTISGDKMLLPFTKNSDDLIDRKKFKPILYYLTQKKLKGNIYLPEVENIYRGDKLFTEFFTINYQNLDNLMRKIGDDSDIIELFDDLHNKIRFKLHLKNSNKPKPHN